MFCFCGFNSIFAINCFGTLTFYKAPSVESAQCGRVSQLAAVRILAVRISCPCPWLHPCPCPGMQLITFAYLYLRAEVEMQLTDIYFRPPKNPKWQTEKEDIALNIYMYIHPTSSPLCRRNQHNYKLLLPSFTHLLYEQIIRPNN